MSTKLLLDLSRGVPFNVYEDELAGAIVLSLFCDARGREPDGSIARGWWGDGLAERKDEWGSRLWELARAKHTAETLARAEDAARDALNWLLDDGIAEALSITAYAPAPSVLGLLIKLDGRRYELEMNHAL